ncbi:MAG: NADPH-dependent 7-cyano-7-deazaguanine reductase QueF, partial [Bacteroidales bacterium]|nr:NADPH-dependent 7-cyano-7-deazaguanine reductase QueF [Bacteroidales bacterium]
PRGGIAIHPFANYGVAGTKYEEMAAHRMLNYRLS